MFSVTVAAQYTTVQWALLFRTEDKAREAFADLGNSQTSDRTVEDDFGQRIRIPAGIVAVTMFENLELSKQARIEMGLHQARTQADAQKRAQNDPALRAMAMAAHQGPAIVQPAGLNGGFPR